MSKAELQKDVECLAGSLKKAAFDKRSIMIAGGVYDPETMKEAGRLLDQALKNNL